MIQNINAPLFYSQRVKDLETKRADEAVRTGSALPPATYGSVSRPPLLFLCSSFPTNSLSSFLFLLLRLLHRFPCLSLACILILAIPLIPSPRART